MKRVRSTAAISKVEGGGNYFAAPKAGLSFIGSGCKTLDLALGGGWAEGRIFNIVGDKSTGKTLLCIEAAANFARKYPEGIIRYAECEAAFDPEYAGALGMPVERVDFGKAFETVEDLFEELTKLTTEPKQPVLYFCDSLDALSDRAEMDRDIDEGTYGAEKAKKMSQLFRRLVQKMAVAKLTLGIVSQVRSKIGMTFGGRTTSRSGGRALDFYASQVLYLAQTGTTKKTVGGITRKTGIEILAKMDKNKVGLPYREASFEIAFGYGIDDIAACLNWLDTAGHLNDVGVAKKDIKKATKDIMKLDDAAFKAEVDRIHAATEKRWYEIEQSFMPTRRKYA